MPLNNMSTSGTGEDDVKTDEDVRSVIFMHETASAASCSNFESSITSGTASQIIPTEEMPVKNAENSRGACILTDQGFLPMNLDEELHSIFTIVKAGTGHDFSSYKSNTVMRRIERRMMVNDVGGIGNISPCCGKIRTRPKPCARTSLSV